MLLLLMLTLSTVMVVVEIGVVSVTTTDLSSPSAAASARCCSTVGTRSTAVPHGGRFFFLGGTDGTSLSSRRTAGGVSVAAVADVSTHSVGNSSQQPHITINTLVYTAFLYQPFPINTPIRGNNPAEQAALI